MGYAFGPTYPPTSPYFRTVSTNMAEPSVTRLMPPPDEISFSTQLRTALADLKQTLHYLETSSSPSHKRLHLNTLTVQLDTLDERLNTAIALLQPTDRRYLPSVLLPDTSLEDIRSLFIAITQTLQQVEVHQSIGKAIGKDQ